MSVDVSQEADYIRHKTYGREVRGSLADGITKIADEVNKYEDTQNQEQANFEDAQKKEQTDYETSITKQQNDYESKINNEFGDYKDALTKKENNFEAAQKQEQVSYESKINSEFGDFKNNMTFFLSDYEIALTKKESNFETKVNSEWSDCKKIMDTDEAERKSNETTRQNDETTRINNESVRQANEVVRKQNEIVRQDNETDRKNNETARETAFNNMQHVDANLELSTARGTFNTLNDRLNSSEGETLANKELIAISHNFNSYPNVRCICTNYGAGVGGAGETPAGGTESYMVNAKICYLDTNNIKIYVPNHYLVKSPVLQKISENKYILSSEDVTETKSMLINLMEVA